MSLLTPMLRLTLPAAATTPQMLRRFAIAAADAAAIDFAAAAISLRHVMLMLHHDEAPPFRCADAAMALMPLAAAILPRCHFSMLMLILFACQRIQYTSLAAAIIISMFRRLRAMLLIPIRCWRYCYIALFDADCRHTYDIARAAPCYDMRVTCYARCCHAR